MTADRKASPERQAADETPQAQPAFSGFARLARQISAWTSRALVSAIILVAGLAFGRQVLQWWAKENDQQGTAATELAVAGGLGDPRVEHTLEFGGHAWNMSRSTVAADAPGALSLLRAKCREALREARAPAGEPGPAEKGLLERLRQKKPASEEPATGGRVYELDAAYPMVIGVRPCQTPSDHLSDRVADPLDRMVTWGIGVPAGPDSWTLYMLHSAPSNGGVASCPLTEPVPTGSTLWLGMRAAGGSIYAFTGSDEPATWRRFFDSWFAAHGWRVKGAWQERDSIWAAHCVGTRPETAGSLDVQFGRNRRGEMTGLVLVTPSSDRSKESEKR